MPRRAHSDTHMHQMWLSSYLYPAVVAAHRLGIYESLSHSPRSIPSVAEFLRISTRAARILVKLSEQLKLIEPVSDTDNYTLTEYGRESVGPTSSYSWNGMFARELNSPLIEEIIRVAQKPDPSDGSVDTLLTNAWAAGDMPENLAGPITLSMHSEGARTAHLHADAITLHNGERVLDVGAGSGVFSFALAEKFPDAEFTLADLPNVLNAAKDVQKSTGARGKFLFQELDFLGEEWPKGFDVIFLSNILHDWPLEIQKMLVEKAFESLNSGGRLIINEMIAHAERGEEHLLRARAFSIVMLIRTLGEQLEMHTLNSLLKGAGFSQIKTLNSEAAFDLIEATK